MSEGYENRPFYRYLLWENPHAGSWNPSSDGNIILSSGDYDYLEFESSIVGGSNNLYCIKIGNISSSPFSVTIPNTDASAIGNNFLMGRTYTRINSTTFSISSGIIARWGASSVDTNNTFCVPVKIYGIKYS